MPNICPSGASLQEATDFLAAHPDIEAIDIVLLDSNGIGRGKIIRRHELEGLYSNWRHLPISILGLDVVGEDVDETGLIWDTGDGDLRAWPCQARWSRNMAQSLPERNSCCRNIILTAHQCCLIPAMHCAVKSMRWPRLACILLRRLNWSFSCWTLNATAKGRCSPRAMCWTGAAPERQKSIP